MRILDFVQTSLEAVKSDLIQFMFQIQVPLMLILAALRLVPKRSQQHFLMM